MRQSGLILTTLPKLTETLDWYIRNPEALAAKRKIARASILRIHDNDRLAKKLVETYRALRDCA